MCDCNEMGFIMGCSLCYVDTDMDMDLTVAEMDAMEFGDDDESGVFDGWVVDEFCEDF